MYYANAVEIVIDARNYMNDVERTGAIQIIDEEDYADADDMHCRAKSVIMNGH